MGELNLQGWQLLVAVLGVMLSMGLLGGLINYQSGTKEDTELSLWKSLCLGVGAAILVPLFLNTIGSSLLSSSKMSYVNLLVFAGFCLLAGYSSKTFMKSVAERLLQEAKQVSKEAKEQAEKVEELVSEPEAPMTVPATKTVNEEKESLGAQTPDQKAIEVLRALTDSRFVIRTYGGIAADVGLTIGEVGDYLKKLERLGLAQILDRPKGLRATITFQGKDFLRKLSPSDDRWGSTK